MAENIVENVRFLQIVQLMGAADKLAGGKAAIGHVVEEDVVGHHARHGNNPPAGALFQGVRQTLEVGNAACRNRQVLQAVHIVLRRPPGDQLHLAFEQRLPRAVFLGRIGVPVLVDRPVGALGDIAADNAMFFRTGLFVSMCIRGYVGVHGGLRVYLANLGRYGFICK